MDDDRKGSVSASAPKCSRRYSCSNVSDSYDIPRESIERGAAPAVAMGAAVAAGAVVSAAVAAVSAAVVAAAAVAALETVVVGAQDASLNPAL